jgi:hypothetical protein
MKESTLVKMQHDIKLLQQAVMVALHRIEKLEKTNKDEDKRSD